MLRVVTYNVHGLRDDRAALVEVVRELAPDVLILQEAPRRLRWRARNAHLAHDLGLVYLAGGAPSLGNVILSSLRVRVHASWELRYPLTPGRHLRGAVFARCQVAQPVGAASGGRSTVGSASFVVVGSHLSIDPAERSDQADRLAAALAGITTSPAAGPEGRGDLPVILGADLNEAPHGPAWRALTGRLVDAAAATVPAGADAGTATGAAAGAAAVTFPPSGLRIDAVLVDPRMTVTGYRVVTSPAAERASDHLPVVVDLDLPGA